ncbi:hypothetical protein ABZ791_02055 [Streptomyces huasconensis]|uniref:Uncharacterized protein n=1 Tax=Streptomyces huasconensis TaxID=1854574 RepID=A0ABV3LRM0_9ACTN
MAQFLMVSVAGGDARTRAYRFHVNWEQQEDDKGPYYPVQPLGSCLLPRKKLACDPNRAVLDRANELLYYVDDQDAELHEFGFGSPERTAKVLNESGVKYRSCFWLPYSGRLLVGHADTGRVDVYGKPRSGSRVSAKLHDHDVGGSDWEKGVRDLVAARVPFEDHTLLLMCALSEHVKSNGKRELRVKSVHEWPQAEETGAGASVDVGFDVPADTRYLSVDPWQHVLWGVGGKGGISRLTLRDPQAIVPEPEGRAVLSRAEPFLNTTRLSRGYLTDQGLCWDYVDSKQDDSGADPAAGSAPGAKAGDTSLVVDGNDILCTYTVRGGDRDLDADAVVWPPPGPCRLRAADIGADVSQRGDFAMAGESCARSYVHNAFAFPGAHGEPLVHMGSGTAMRRIIQDATTGEPRQEWSDGTRSHSYPYSELPLPYRDLLGPGAQQLNWAWSLRRVSGAYTRGGRVHFLIWAHYDPEATATLVALDPNRVSDPHITVSTELTKAFHAQSFAPTACCEIDSDRVLLLGYVSENGSEKASWWLYNADADKTEGEPRALAQKEWPHAYLPWAAFRGYDKRDDPNSKSQRRVLRVYTSSGEEIAWTLGRTGGGDYRITVHEQAPKFLASATPPGTSGPALMHHADPAGALPHVPPEADRRVRLA